MVKVGTQGRIVIPAAIREKLGFEIGEELLTWVEDGRLVLERRKDVSRRLRGRYDAIASGRNLSEELISERRREAEAEATDADDIRPDKAAGT